MDSNVTRTVFYECHRLLVNLNEETSRPSRFKVYFYGGQSFNIVVKFRMNLWILYSFQYTGEIDFQSFNYSHTGILRKISVKSVK